MSEEKPYTEAELTSGVRDPEDVYRAALPGDPANPPARGKLTVIWEEEKQAFHDRLDIHAKSIEALMQRAQTLEAWALQLRREPQRSLSLKTWRPNQPRRSRVWPGC